MKNLLIPITSIIWAIVTYFCLSYVLVAQYLTTNVSWFWLIILYPIIIGFIGLLYNIAGIVSLAITYFYKFSRASLIIHCLFGIIGFVFSIIYYIEDDKFIEIYSKMWECYPIKTILLTPGFVGLYLSIIYAMIINPIITILETKHKNNVEKITDVEEIKSCFITDVVTDNFGGKVEYISKNEDDTYNIVVTGKDSEPIIYSFELDILENMGFKLKYK